MKTLAEVAALTETGDNPFELRFENTTDAADPHWIANEVPTIQKVHGPICSFQTALAIACTSYGRYQILGANIYAAPSPYAKTIFHFAFDDDGQLAAFDRFIAQKGFNADETPETWDDTRGLAYAAFYNGPGNPQAYWDEMRSHF
jgi:hypothetical protein